MKEAAEVYGAWGLEIGVGLFCASLPTAYAAARGVQVLQITARLQTDTKRRILETGQFLLDALAPGGFTPHGHAIRTIQKVRLMHATVRHIIRLHIGRSGRDLSSAPMWDGAWGVPINQEDLAGTMLAFSLVPVRILPLMGIRLPAHQQRAYVHHWNVVAAMLGVESDLLPASVDEAMDLAAAIERRNLAESAAGQELTRALVDTMRAMMRHTPFRELPEPMIRRLSGNDVADMLGVAPYPWSWRLINLPLQLAGLIFGDIARFHRATRLAAPFGRALMIGLTTMERGGDRANFAIPLELEQRWALRDG
jgi:hypothetical protein